MRVRKVDASGDMTFGQNQRNFWRDVPEAVGQVVVSRLNLWQGDWYLDRDEGTPYQYRVLGKRTDDTRDTVLQARMLDSPGVAAIRAYTSGLDRQTRAFSVSATLSTIYSGFDAQGRAVGTADVATSVYRDR